VTGTPEPKEETRAISPPDRDRVPQREAMLYRRGGVRSPETRPLKKIAAIDSALLSLAGVSPGWKINLRTGGRRWLGQRLRERSECCLETRNAQKKSQDALNSR
jgi:hypothetical protein